jgi:hypothetical protein
VKDWTCGTLWGEYNLKGRPWFRWEDNIRMDIKEVEWRGMDWIHLGPNRVKWWTVMNMVMNIQVETIIHYIESLQH